MATVTHSTNLTAASNQWATRPADQRFWGLDDLHSNLSKQRARSHEEERHGTNVRVGSDGGSLHLLGDHGRPITMTNWSFGQVCNYANAPSSYLRTLPAELVADNLNHGLEKKDEKTTNLLLQANDHNLLLRSLSSEHYGRLWNNDIVQGLRHNAIKNGWRVPPARPAMFDDDRARPATSADILPNQGDFALAVKLGDRIAPAGVYKSDRDMFIFLVHPERIIDDGGHGMMRGVFIWNSEVGAGAFKVQSFYLENVCGNHIVWGASNVKTLRVIHKKGAIAKMGDKVRRQLDSFAAQDTGNEERMIVVARQHMLGSNEKEVVESLYNNKSLALSKGDIEATFRVAEKWEHTAMSPPTSAWGFVHGLTRYSQEKIHTDARTKLDAAGGRILELAAKAHGVNTKMLALPAPR